ncbi:hypothetical protein LUZ60_008851 [Juncus effusus]|nr:hypothetical protein LUZ60_008851 [Juncus effusus]
MLRVIYEEKENHKKPSTSLIESVGSQITTCFENRASISNSKWIPDPDGYIILVWNRIFFLSCLSSLCIDPLFFYLPFIENKNEYWCVTTDRRLAGVLTFLRSLMDFIYVLNMVIKFHTAHVDPVSRVVGKGELISDEKFIANRYFKRGFYVDLLASFPFPQILVWFILPRISSNYANNPYLLIIVFQYTIRVYQGISLSMKIIQVEGFIARTAWGGSVYNLLLYLMASHVVGAIYYLLTVERQATCWKSQCLIENSFQNSKIPCNFIYMECKNLDTQDSKNWANNTSIFSNCNANNRTIPFNFGIFLFALQYGAVTTSFSEKYFYCLWWGFQQLSTYGNPLVTSSFLGENLFSIGLTILSLGLFAQLIGSMQIYMKSISVNMEEWRVKQREMEQWMRDHRLPEDLQEKVSRFFQYKWISMQGVEEESILKDLPTDIRRAIQRHLCMDLVRRVPFFSEMDNQLLDSICECMVPFLRTENTYIMREGEPVREMLFIIRGILESSTSKGSGTDFFNSTILKPGDFCGEELITWVIMPRPEIVYPSSMRTVRTLTEVEAFTLRAEDLKVVSTRYRRLHSKNMQHKFRFYSHSWRTWAARFIQAVWRRHVSKRSERKEENNSRREPFFSLVDERMTENEIREERIETQPVPNIASIFRCAHTERPEEPDFSADE